MRPDGHHSHLPLALALFYTLCIAYASLFPFIRLEFPLPGTPFWLFELGPLYRSDLIINFFAYLPLGLFVGLAGRRFRLLRAAVYGALLSLAMESCQWLMPPRSADLYDLLANTAGAATGGALAWGLAALTPLRERLYRWRSLFLPGWLGDFGLALLVFWLAAQANSGIPLFSMAFDPAVLAAIWPDSAMPIADIRWSTLAEALITAFQITGIGLFAALLARHRRHAVLMAVLLILAALLLKTVATVLSATGITDATAFQHLARAATWMALALGLLLLYALFSLSRPKTVIACAIILLSSLLAALLLPDLLATRTTSLLLNDHYTHLLHFDGLTRTILLVWPAAAGIWLFLLAGRPGWGEQGSGIRGQKDHLTAKNA